MRSPTRLLTYWTQVVRGGYPFAGSRMLRGLLALQGCKIGRRHVKTLVKRMGIEALYRRPRTTKPEPGHKIYPYLLRGMAITRPNQVWAMDITHIPMERGFVYLAVVLDWATRRVLSWRLSITMEAAFCVETLEDALARYGKPEIFNTDQGSQFTCGPTKASAKLGARSAGISISTMAADRIKALTTPHRIKPTSTNRQSAWRPKPGRRSTYRRGYSVQTTGTSSGYVAATSRWAKCAVRHPHIELAIYTVNVEYVSRKLHDPDDLSQFNITRIHEQIVLGVYSGPDFEIQSPSISTYFRSISCCWEPLLQPCG